MYCSGHIRILLLTAAMFLPGAISALTQSTSIQGNAQAETTSVHLRWGPRPGVTRYRLQLASDRAFAGIVFDRVVAGNDYQVNDLPPGRYFWRIAPLTNELGEFSSAGIIDVSEPTSPARPTPLPSLAPVNDSFRDKIGAADRVITHGGWRAAVGDIAHPVLAHLRAPATLDLVGINSDGVTFALDASSGVALWSTTRRAKDSSRIGSDTPAVLLLRSRSGLDNVVLLLGRQVTAIEGATGRQLWQTTLPAIALSGTIARDNSALRIVLVDNSAPRLFFLDPNNGELLSQVSLPHRVVGGPVTLVGQGADRILLAYESGQIEIRDPAGAILRAGNAGTPATTSPVFIKARRGDYVLVGTRGGLAALTADGLSPLGLVAIKDDAPQGSLAVADLDGDGLPEVIVLTEHGRVLAVNASDGKILWDAAAANAGQEVAFADVDGDRILDVLLAGGQSFALALSGRDGSVVWKDSQPSALVANHSVSVVPRSIVAMPYGSGALVISGDPAQTGLRAVEFPEGSAPIKY